ncbi:MAG: hypothetical protein M1830_010849, partial [Pleopsidium flavum]
MATETVYVVTCYVSSEHGESTDILCIFKSLASANVYASTHLNGEYEMDWQEYEEETSSDGIVSVSAVAEEGERFEVTVLVEK